jgi:transposase-like protein
LDGVRIETAKAAQVVNLLVEGVGIRAPSRLTGLDQGTILNILKTAGEHCARLLDAKIQNGIGMSKKMVGLASKS